MARKNKTDKRDKKDTIQAETTEYEENTLNNVTNHMGKSEPAQKETTDDDVEGKKQERSKEPDSKKQDLKEIVEKLAEMQDKYIRLSAEFDNYRKRTLREKMDISKYAGENLLVNILPLMDDFDRALSHMDSAADCTAMKNGIDLIYGKFHEFLIQNGVKEIESLNSKFDMDLHEAVAKVKVEEEDKKGKVVDVVLKGYYIQDKVLRFSKVVVGE